MTNSDIQQQIEAKKAQNELDSLSPDRLARMTTTAGKVTEALNAGTDVLTATTTLKRAVMTLYSEFEGAAEFKDRHRTIELLIVNATQRRLVWETSFFDSGTTFAGPVPVNVVPVNEEQPTGASLWAVANGQGSIMTGVSGAGKWRIEGTNLALVIGFTNPQFGGLKSEIAIVGRDAEPRVAYDACDNAEAKQHSTLGYVVRVYADHAQAGGYRRFVYCIAEEPGIGTLNRGDRLQSGESLHPGGFLMSPNGRYAAVYEALSGNLVTYDLTKLRGAVWRSGSGNRNAQRCEMNNDGVFLIREDENRTAWAAPKSSPGGYVQLSDSGALVLRDRTDQVVWSSQ